ncbi:MAG: hypothetical protein R6V04_16995 [bacterium]
MQYTKVVGILICLILILFGCTNYTMTSYDKLEATNYLIITQFSGNKITGTVIDIKPHQLIVLQDDESRRAVTRSTIKSIKQKRPVYDEFGRGISEPEIESVKTTNNTVIYGIGGGILSFGVSFFMGSLLGESGSSVALATGGGGILGTTLFIIAGSNKDRKDAISEIREIRKTDQFQKEQKGKANINTGTRDSEDKEQIENLEKRREELLQKLKEMENEKKKKKKEY